ncbi:NUDIX hydrolase [candidate division WWE3 bacterium]|uniref:NUDIX hydrolase n=1 Tax=candidate division WWE3 bacterium TaxID=2053526 RepID=A0A955LKF9_UNCKA|nr:NUDIX hydrolase [candidate division WWE3 bacterium]
MANEEIFHIGVKALIRNNDGNILLLKVNPEVLKNNQHGVYWDIPGGRIQKGQDAASALSRELLEELGLAEFREPELLSAVISSLRIPVHNGDVGLALFVYTVKIEKNISISLSNEHTEYNWFPPREAAEKLAVKYPQEFTELVGKL